MSAPFATNGTPPETTDEMVDRLYAWFPPQAPAPAPCPEAAFSLTLKGKLDGVEALLTVRGQTAAEFQRHLQAIRGLLDPPQAPSPGAHSQDEEQHWCPTHGDKMQRNHKDGRSWWSHKTADGWCKGK